MFWKPTKHSNFWNFMLWFSMLIGLGGLMCLYSIEWYARRNCAQSFVRYLFLRLSSLLFFLFLFKDSFIVDFVLPRSFTCGRKDMMVLNAQNVYKSQIRDIEL